MTPADDPGKEGHQVAACSLLSWPNSGLDAWPNKAVHERGFKHLARPVPAELADLLLGEHRRTTAGERTAAEDNQI
jgi:hypothetical protein